MTDHRGTVRRYWQSAEARDWDTFGALLTDDVRYEMPQTRERIQGRERYLQFNREYPGDWRIVLDEVLVDGDRAVSRVTATVGDETQQAVAFFGFTDGRIAEITDFWPDPYTPPPGREHLVDRY